MSLLSGTFQLIVVQHCSSPLIVLSRIVEIIEPWHWFAYWFYSIYIYWGRVFSLFGVCIVLSTLVFIFLLLLLFLFFLFFLFLFLAFSSQKDNRFLSILFSMVGTIWCVDRYVRLMIALKQDIWNWLCSHVCVCVCLFLYLYLFLGVYLRTCLDIYKIVGETLKPFITTTMDIMSCNKRFVTWQVREQS